MTSKRLATLLGVHPKTIQNWGNGTSLLSVRDRLALRYIELELKMAVTVSTSTLLGYDGDGKPIYGDTTVIGTMAAMPTIAVNPTFPLFNPQEVQIAALIVSHFSVDASQVTRTASLIDDLGADSLDVVELVMALENEFNIEISDEEGEAADTVEKVFNLIAAKKS